jgi:hypothetical protein
MIRLILGGYLNHDPGAERYEQQYRERTLDELKKKARSMGFVLVARPDDGESVS